MLFISDDIECCGTCGGCGDIMADLFHLHIGNCDELLCENCVNELKNELTKICE